MALHTQLPIYKVAYGLFDVTMDLAKNMPRDFKASIGGKLRDECIEILTLIWNAKEKMRFDTSEAAYHWEKFPHDEDIQTAIINDRVEGRDAASSRRVPSHDGLAGSGSTE